MILNILNTESSEEFWDSRAALVSGDFGVSTDCVVPWISGNCGNCRLLRIFRILIIRGIQNIRRLRII